MEAIHNFLGVLLENDDIRPREKAVTIPYLFFSLNSNLLFAGFIIMAIKWAHN